MIRQTHYKVLSGHGLHQLETAVAEALLFGWHVIGGVAVDTESGRYLQTAVMFADANVEMTNIEERAGVDGDTVRLIRDGGGA